MSKNLRVPLQSIVVIRDDKRVEPKIGEPFEFTAEEIADVERTNPDAFSTKAEVDVTETKVAKKSEKKEDL